MPDGKSGDANRPRVNDDPLRCEEARPASPEGDLLATARFERLEIRGGDDCAAL